MRCPPPQPPRVSAACLPWWWAHQAAPPPPPAPLATPPPPSPRAACSQPRHTQSDIASSATSQARLGLQFNVPTNSGMGANLAVLPAACVAGAHIQAHTGSYCRTLRACKTDIRWHDQAQARHQGCTTETHQGCTHHAYGVRALPVSSRTGLGAWQATCCGLGGSTRERTTRQKGLVPLVSPCVKSNAPGPARGVGDEGTNE